MIGAFFVRLGGEAEGAIAGKPAPAGLSAGSDIDDHQGAVAAGAHGMGHAGFHQVHLAGAY